MARIITTAALKGVPALPAFQADFNEYLKVERAYIDKVGEICRKANLGSTVGEALSWPFADGAAIYVVYSERPLILVHLEIGDAYRLPPSYERGINFAEVEAQVADRRDQRASANAAEQWRASLGAGEVLHYHHAFGRFVRCAVVEVGGHNALVPVALVGPWDERDLDPRGHWPTKIRERDAWWPHEGNIYEYPAALLRERYPDPGAVEPLAIPEPYPDVQASGGVGLPVAWKVDNDDVVIDVDLSELLESALEEADGELDGNVIAALREVAGRSATVTVRWR